MVTAVDSSVLLDVLLKDGRHFERSKAALRQAHAEGRLVIGETALAEVCPALAEEEIPEMLADWELTFLASSKDSAVLAGQMYATYLKRGGRREGVLADFLIGAHAQLQAVRLLARDRGFYHDYFKKLRVWDPSE